jgi:hypothetical protein
MSLIKIGTENAERINLAQDRAQWSALYEQGNESSGSMEVGQYLG